MDHNWLYFQLITLLTKNGALFIKLNIVTLIYLFDVCFSRYSTTEEVSFESMVVDYVNY